MHGAEVVDLGGASGVDMKSACCVIVKESHLKEIAVIEASVRVCRLLWDVFLCGDEVHPCLLEQEQGLFCDLWEVEVVR